MGNPDQFTKISTDDSLMETVAHGSDAYPFRYYYEDLSLFDFSCVDWHWHSEIEFVYIETGHVIFDSGEDHFCLNPGEGIMINSKVLHKMSCHASAVIPNFLFNPAFIAPAGSLIYEKYVSPVISSSTDFIVFRPDEPWQRDALEIIKDIIAAQNKQSSNELFISMQIQKLWMIIFSNNKFEPAENRLSASRRTRLQLMMEFIHSDYSKNINLDDIAGAADISKSTALHLFQDNLQTTPVNYLISYRLKKAARLLANTEKKITAIALETGFNNADYFCRSFKKAYGVTPGDYRAHALINK